MLPIVCFTIILSPGNNTLNKEMSSHSLIYTSRFFGYVMRQERETETRNHIEKVNVIFYKVPNKGSNFDSDLKILEYQ